MADKNIFKTLKRTKIRKRIRKQMSGTSEKPRLAVFRSLKHIYAQLIDDDQGHTLVQISSLSEPIKTALKEKGKGKISISKLIGIELAKTAKTKGIETVVFDRGGYQYHGRVKAVAEGAREGGLKF
jgi:large subunit ribosomal protein L18